MQPRGPKFCRRQVKKSLFITLKRLTVFLANSLLNFGIEFNVKNSKNQISEQWVLYVIVPSHIILVLKINPSLRVVVEPPQPNRVEFLANFSQLPLARGCGTIGRTVTSNTRGPGFE